MELLRQGRLLVYIKQAGCHYLRIGENHCKRFLVPRNGYNLLCRFFLLLRDYAEELLDFSFNIIDIHIAYNYYSLIPRIVPCLIEIHELLRVKSKQALLVADDIAVCILCTLVQNLEKSLLLAALCGISASPFLDDDSSLFLNFTKIVGHESGVVLEDYQSSIHKVLPVCRNGAQSVDRTLNAGHRVYVGTEDQAVLLKVAHHGVSREILVSVETHVLQEMGQTSLGRGLVDCTYIGGNIEFSPVLRIGIMLNKIGKAIVQVSYPD